MQVPALCAGGAHLLVDHFEADQASRLRSWLPGSYQLGRLRALPSPAGFGRGLGCLSQLVEWNAMSKKGTEDVLPVSKALASLLDPHLCLATGYQMAFDARKLSGWSQEGEKPGQRVGVIQLPLQDRTGGQSARLLGWDNSLLAGRLS